MSSDPEVGGMDNSLCLQISETQGGEGGGGVLPTPVENQKCFNPKD